ncbi:2-dehydropantoate 2-reductase [Herbaspirillum seropedicae]|uniref:2-dehydropantoate 2-reductase n=1 Tax=Herbaspirillum seropedicae (strain SmR1) TaxID=757424 RepID=D8J1P3_HERSS|nr:2-dehydropantoate 2-reductase [Herbaspirillum seropedicae]ADJ62664.1 2-dehydropantoate 2-reductase protein [Herbaspirillum seropedicae SmR1]AKN64771.1 2-dehydropantoate 2-reductase [Herbaspirillum seropedicae]NQE31723.1 2-dehydropantoate 2-reductase [Herbaspirillum seropedicae]UMU20713.1 2-dehydropantoate 2-reductase [Herbaspirillum seropedicae]
MKIAIVGAGAMGGLFAARLALAGQDVSLIEVAPASIEAISSHGLSLTDEDGAHTVRVPVGRADSFQDAFDLIILFTKGFHTQAAIASVAHLAGPHTWALSVQNGLGNADLIAEVIPRERIIVGMTNLPADLRAPGVVHSHGEGQVRIWTLSGQPSAQLTQVAADFNAAGLPCSADPLVQQAIWEKLAFNAALNAICAVTGLTVGAAGASASGRELALRIAAETVAVAQAAGIDARLVQVEDAIEHAFRTHLHHKPSMLQDIEAGRRTEIDFINGAVVREAERLGLPVPTTQTLHQLVKLMEGAAQAQQRPAAQTSESS